MCSSCHRAWSKNIKRRVKSMSATNARPVRHPSAPRRPGAVRQPALSDAAPAMPREKRAANASSKREKAELAELAERVLSEAPAKGSNPLLAEGDEVEEAGKVVYDKRKKFCELPISKRTLDGLAGGKFQRMTDIQRAAIPHALAGRDVLGAMLTQT